MQRKVYMEEENKNAFEYKIWGLKMVEDRTLKTDFVVDSLEKAIYVANDLLQDSPNEQLLAIALNSEKKPIGCSIVAMGNNHTIPSYCVRNIFQFALTSNADSFVLVHNHPQDERLFITSGDNGMIENINRIASELNIRFRDFIVVGNKKHKRAYYSWESKRLIEDYSFQLKINNQFKNKRDTIPSVLDEINEDGEVTRSIKKSEANKEPVREKSHFGFFR